jgi:CRP-like cAMP-binding protein
MKNLGRLSNTLQGSADLGHALNRPGKTEHFRAGSILFHAGDKNVGIFLVRRGKVCLQVPGAPHLNRVFAAGSVLGLPSTFVRRPYSLTAACVTECEIAHVGTKEFLGLMASCPDLCREATEILSREVTFIFSALGERSQKLAVEGRHESTALGRIRRASATPA